MRCRCRPQPALRSVTTDNENAQNSYLFSLITRSLPCHSRIHKLLLVACVLGVCIHSHGFCIRLRYDATTMFVFHLRICGVREYMCVFSDVGGRRTLDGGATNAQQHHTRCTYCILAVHSHVAQPTAAATAALGSTIYGLCERHKTKLNTLTNRRHCHSSRRWW